MIKISFHSAFFSIITFLVFSFQGNSQIDFKYDIQIEEMTIPNMDGLHSYAFGQIDGKWIIVGGRRDGIHARQPFNAFPENQNNTTIYIADPESGAIFTASIESLSNGLKEQLQSTNMQFYQDENTLFFVGGYGYSATEEDHITFPNLTAIDLDGLVTNILAGEAINDNFEQITDDIFAVTGGNLGKIGDDFLLVSGHRFDGRYNPMNHPTFVQTYSNQIRKFKINTENGLTYSDYLTFTDEVHLHRRDYNLLPQILPDGSFGYTIYSGVFQINADLPFLYPVDIHSNGYTPQTQFNQQLANYHSAKIPLYNIETETMHNLFFGGISQYYFSNGTLIQDDDVPFVKTISRVSRGTNGIFEEVAFQNQMPAYVGAGAEFIINPQLPTIEEGIINLNELESDSILLGYIFGGIESPAQNPFTFNNTEVTFASNTIFKVHLVSNETSAAQTVLPGYHKFAIRSINNPVKDSIIKIKMDLSEAGDLDIHISNIEGKLILNETIENLEKGELLLEIPKPDRATGINIVTLILNRKYYASEKIFFED